MTAAPADRAALIREVIDRLETRARQAPAPGARLHSFRDVARVLIAELHDMADEAPQPETQAQLETLPLLFWDESAGAVHHDGRIALWVDRAVNLAQYTPAGQLILRVETARALRRVLTTALNDAAVAQQPQEADGDRIVAYSSPGGTALFCTRHRDELSAYWPPVFSEDLPDGGICAHSTCGADLLIPQQPEAAEGAQR